MHYLEQALHDAITSDLFINVTNVQTLIRLIRLDPNCSLKKRDEYGKSFLQLAIEHKKQDIAMQLWRQADDDIFFGTCNEGNTLLNTACKANSLFFVELILVKIMLEKDALERINQPNGRGQTALHLSFDKPNIEIIVGLINHGAALHVHDNDGVTPSDLVHRLTPEQLETLSKAEGLNTNEDYRYQFLDKDRVRINSVISECTHYIDSLENKERIPVCNQIFGTLIPLVPFALLLRELLFTDTKSSAFFAVLKIFGSSIGTGFGLLAGFALTKQETQIQPEEWQMIIDHLKTNVIDPINNQPDAIDAPLYWDGSALRYDANLLNTSTSIPISLVRKIFISMISDLTRLEAKMNLTRTPFSFYKPPAKVTEGEDNKSELLPAP